MSRAAWQQKLEFCFPDFTKFQYAPISDVYICFLHFDTKTDTLYWDHIRQISRRMAEISVVECEVENLQPTLFAKCVVFLIYCHILYHMSVLDVHMAKHCITEYGVYFAGYFFTCNHFHLSLSTIVSRNNRSPPWSRTYVCTSRYYSSSDKTWSWT